MALYGQKQTKAEILAGVKDVVTSKKVANNTVEYTTTDGKKHIRLHNTTIMTFEADRVTLNTEGWKSVTTKERMNRFLSKAKVDAQIYQERGLWWVTQPGEGNNPYFDEIQLDLKTGLVLNPRRGAVKRDEDLKNKINKLVAKLDKLDKLPKPDNGDCWYCLMHTQEGTPLGDFSGNDHILLHVKEGYLHGSLIVNALKWKGFTDEQVAFYYGVNYKDRVKLILRRYLKTKLGLPR